MPIPSLSRLREALDEVDRLHTEDSRQEQPTDVHTSRTLVSQTRADIITTYALIDIAESLRALVAAQTKGSTR